MKLDLHSQGMSKQPPNTERMYTEDMHTKHYSLNSKVHQSIQAALSIRVYPDYCIQ